MKKIRLSSWQSGLTLVEMVATIVIAGIVMMGLTLSARTVLAHYQMDTVRLDVRHYGNTVMREIYKELNLAKHICVENTNGFARLDLSWKDKFGLINRTVISANTQEGILFDYERPLDGNLSLPNKGAFRTRNQHFVTLRDFRVSQQPVTSAFLADFSRSTWDIILELELVMNTAPGGAKREVFRFKRTVFMPNRYISMKDQICL